MGVGVAALGVLGSEDVKGEPAGALNGRGNGEEAGGEAPGTFESTSKKFVGWNFLYVDTLPFPAPPLLAGPGANLCSVLRGFPRRLGWGWEARLGDVGEGKS